MGMSILVVADRAELAPSILFSGKISSFQKCLRQPNKAELELGVFGEMVLIHLNEVPPYLQCGALFASFDLNDDAQFEVPDECFKRETSVNDEADFASLLKSLRFWLVDEIPIECFAFAVCTQTMNVDCVTERHFAAFEKQLAKYARVRGSEFCDRIATAITIGLGVNFVRCLHENGCILSEDDCVAAAYQDDHATLMYLHEHRCPWDERTVAAAIITGQIGCLDYALQHSCPHVPALCTELAVIGGPCEVLDYLLLRGLPVSTNALTLAVTLNRLDCLKKLVHAEMQWPDGACLYAVQRRNLEMLTFLHENGCPFGQTSAECCAAAETDQLECLDFLHTHGAVWDAETMYVAAEKGHLLCLQYAFVEGCEVGQGLLGAAIVGRHWECIRFALLYGSFPLLKLTLVTLSHSTHLLPRMLFMLYRNLTNLRADAMIVFHFFPLTMVLGLLSVWLYLIYIHFGRYLKAYCSEKAFKEISLMFLVAAGCSLVTLVVSAVLYGTYVVLEMYHLVD